MVHCTFENTTLAMEQLIKMLAKAREGDIQDFFYIEMSQDEYQAYRKMSDVCERLMEAIEATDFAEEEQACGFTEEELEELACEFEEIGVDREVD